MGNFNLREQFRAQADDEELNLTGYPTNDTPGVSGKKAGKKELIDIGEQLFDLHEMLHATGEESILLVLQGVDCSGKNGTIKHVINRVNPVGVSIASFEKPTQKEKDHHFLWRIRKGVPPMGRLGVFNRSHYEDVIEPTVNQAISDKMLNRRFNDILRFEQKLADSGITLVKCLLHISYDEQRERFLRRLRRDDKRWKFDRSDMENRRLWDQYQAAYGQVIARTSSQLAPWYIIPSDRKWYRNWAIAHLLVEVMEELGLTYPQPTLPLDELREALAPPN